MPCFFFFSLNIVRTGVYFSKVFARKLVYIIEANCLAQKGVKLMLFLVLYLSFGFIMALGLATYSLITDRSDRDYIRQQGWKAILRLALYVMKLTVAWPIVLAITIHRVKKTIRNVQKQFDEQFLNR